MTGAGEQGQGSFGDAVALTADGSTALLGGEYDAVNDVNGGAVWVFTRTGSKWAEQGPKLPVPGGQTFGSAVALSADGNTAVIGEEGYGESGEFGGSGAWVFVRAAGNWAPQRQSYHRR